MEEPRKKWPAIGIGTILAIAQVVMMAIIIMATYPYIINIINQSPTIFSLTSNKESPLDAGELVTFTAEAYDENNDDLLYSFYLNQVPVTGWTTSNTWTWMTGYYDIGEYSIEVRVRDGKHADAKSYDDRASINFIIIQPIPLTGSGSEILRENKEPHIDTLYADRDSPQEAGKTIIWTAKAYDPEADSLFYRFLVNGKPATSWMASNIWAWSTNQSDIGDNQIEVWVRDEMHADTGSYDDSKTNLFKIIPHISPYYFKQIDEIVTDEYNNLPVGQMIFNCPYEMTVGVTEDVMANVTKEITVEPKISEAFANNITRRLEKLDDPQLRKIETAKIKVAPRMIAKLFGNNFEIVSRTPDEQATTINDVTSWKWSVTPNKNGLQKLFLTVDIVIEIPGYPDRAKHLRELEKEIDVKVNPLYFIECNWQFIITTIISSGVLGFLIAWIIRNYKDGKNKQKDSQNVTRSSAMSNKASEATEQHK
jgi:hypothetical protein